MSQRRKSTREKRNRKHKNLQEDEYDSSDLADGQKKNNSPTGAEQRCDYCRAEITNRIRIRCAECTDFDLCIECFVTGVEVSSHKRDHRYHVIETVRTPIFDSEWSGDEEKLLVEAISLYGFGNWADIAEHVASKSKYRCETHYIRKYLSSDSAPFPLPLSGDKEKGEPKKDEEKEYNSKIKKFSGKIKSIKPYVYPSLNNSPPPIPKSWGRSKIHPSLLNTAIIGFSPQRGDFETEFENDAEKLLADLRFSDTDSPSETELKIKVLRIYNRTLDKRRERKEFLLERGLPSFFSKNKRKLSSEENEIQENLKPLVRFHSEEDHEKLLNGLYNELRLRSRIEELQNYLLNGYRTFSELAKVKQKQKNVEPKIPTELKSGIKKAKIDGNSSANNTNSLEEINTNQLSETEKNLCKDIKLNPNEYLSIRNAIEREAYVKGMLDKSESECKATIKIQKTDRQLNFIIHKGWEDNKNGESGEVINKI